MNITGEDLVKGKIKLIYEKFIFSQLKHRSFTNYSRLHLKIFPNYLKTFNYKLSVDILPCKIKFVDFALDTDSKCNFCNINADSLYHVFSHCTAIKFLWEALDRVLSLMGFHFRFVIISSCKRMAYGYSKEISNNLLYENWLKLDYVFFVQINLC